jgi:Helix-turn-helix domain
MTLQPQWPSIPNDRLSVEFFLPAPALRPFVSGYNIYGSFGPKAGQREIFFPGWTTVRFNYNIDQWTICYGRSAPETVAPCAIFGPSVNDIQSERTPVGMSVGFGITPLGMARLFRQPASHFAGRQVDLGSIWPETAAIRSAIAELSDADALAPFLDALLTKKLGPELPGADQVAALARLLVDQHDIEVGHACAQLGLSDGQLRRLALRHFGFPPKLLLRRSRFLKSLMAIIGKPAGQWSQLIDASYFDQSHFIRDCHEFLGTSPGDFLMQERPMTILSMAQRAKILGAPVMTLHQSKAPLPVR